MTTPTDMQQAVNAIRQQKFAEASTLLSQILKRQPGNAEARWLLVGTLESQQEFDSALEQLRQLLIHVRKVLPAIDQIAGHMRQKRYPLHHVLKAYKAYLAENPGSATASFNYAYNLSKEAQFEDAIRMYEQSLKLGIDAPEEVHLNIANIYMDHLHAADKARASLEKALNLNARYSSAYYNLGNLFEQQGNRDEAILNFEQCLKLDPENEAALARLADAQVFAQKGDPMFTRLVAVAETSNNSDVHFALGKVYEQLGDFKNAWEHFSRGNALDSQANVPYSPALVEAQFERIRSAALEVSPNPSGEQRRGPVFICGMFRSGSTLLEQLLAAHPHFTAGGESEFFPRLVAREFPDYPDGLDNITPEKLRAWQHQHAEQVQKPLGESCRLTDKRPDNFLYVGLIKAVLPAARFLVTERDWRDIATSVYSVRLGPSQSYATSLENIRHYIRLQTQLVEHWATLLGSDLKRVRYESLIQQPKQTVSDVLDWLGESWDERCLNFHELKNSVRTASVWQVREPLHSKSVGRWKRYEPYFVEAFGSDPDR